MRLTSELLGQHDGPRMSVMRSPIELDDRRRQTPASTTRTARQRRAAIRCNESTW